MSAVAIEFRDVTVRAWGRCLLDIPHLEIPAGQVVALLGPNGAGKTTFARACLGLAKPASGSVRVLGRDVRALRGGDLAAFRARIGYVPQLPPTRGEMPLTVREVAALGCTARVGLLRPLTPAHWRCVGDWLERLGIAALAERAFSEISGGEQRKTVLARAMVQEPDFLILDEPTAHLDLGWRERVVETIERLHRDTRLGVLLICHELEVLPPSCRAVVVLETGRVLAQGAPAAVLTPECVRRLYGPGLRLWQAGGRHSLLPAEEAHA